MRKNEVYHLKLVNGHDIICKYIRRSKDIFTVTDVMVVDEVKDFSTGASQLFLNKYTLGLTPEIEVSKGHVVMMERVNPIIEAYYNATKSYSEQHMEPNKYAEIIRVTNALKGALEPQSENNQGQTESEDNKLLIFGEPSNEAFVVLPTVKTIN